jgi:hypothetical protein
LGVLSFSFTALTVATAVRLEYQDPVSAPACFTLPESLKVESLGFALITVSAMLLILAIAAGVEGSVCSSLVRSWIAPGATGPAPKNPPTSLVRASMS